MQLKKLMGFFLLLLCACLLAIVLMSGKIIPLQTTSAHPLTSAGMCHISMMPQDETPGEGWKRHNKSVSVESGTDYTDMYSDGKVYITYNDPSHGGWYFDTNSYWVQTGPDANVWDIRTRWTLFNPTFVSGDWQLWYPC